VVIWFIDLGDDALVPWITPFLRVGMAPPSILR